MAFSPNLGQSWVGENCPLSTTVSTQLHYKTDRHIAKLNATARISAEFESQGISKKISTEVLVLFFFWGGGGGVNKYNIKYFYRIVIFWVAQY